VVPVLSTDFFLNFLKITYGFKKIVIMIHGIG
jgi:hypothetical protein